MQGNLPAPTHAAGADAARVGIAACRVFDPDPRSPSGAGSSWAGAGCELLPASADDLPALLRMPWHDDVWPWFVGERIPEAHWAVDLRRLLARNEAGAPCLWVLRDADRRLGFLSLEGGEMSFLVDGALLGRGAGSAMLRMFRAIARRDLLLARLKACVQRGNVRAVRCLERQGFRFAGLSRRAFARPGATQAVLIFETNLEKE